MSKPAAASDTASSSPVDTKTTTASAAASTAASSADVKTTSATTASAASSSEDTQTKAEYLRYVSSYTRVERYADGRRVFWSVIKQMESYILPGEMDKWMQELVNMAHRVFTHLNRYKAPELIDMALWEYADELMEVFFGDAHPNYKRLFDIYNDTTL